MGEMNGYVTALLFENGNCRDLPIIQQNHSPSARLKEHVVHFCGHPHNGLKRILKAALSFDPKIRHCKLGLQKRSLDQYIKHSAPFNNRVMNADMGFPPNLA